jgi:hypothetical protein
MLMIVMLEGIVAEAPSTPGSVWAEPVGALLKVGSRIISVVEEERVQKCCA